MFVVTMFDPFDFESVTKRQSANIIYKIYSAHYPTKQRDKISVVLLDDETLKNLDEPWPPSHLVHGQVLSALLSYKPAAVLVDIFFVHHRDNDHFASTDYAIDQYEEKGVPLFVVAAGRSTQAPQPARPEILRKEKDHKLALVSAEIFGELGNIPLYPLHEVDHREPAALAVYHSICSRLPDLPKFTGDTSCTVPLRNSEDMEVVWGLEPAPFNCDRALTSSIAQVCDEVFTSVIGRAVQLLWEALFPRDWRPTDPMPLPYHSTISTRDLLDGTKRQQLKSQLSGKVVIYGAHISLVKDLVFNPVHGNTDGAFFHAMALDNLLTFGNSYMHQSLGSRTFHKEWSEFQPAFLMVFTSLMVMWNRRRLLSQDELRDNVHLLRGEDEKFLRVVRWLLIITIVIVGIIEFNVGFSPFNWLALLIVVEMAHQIDRWFFSSIVSESQDRQMAARGTIDANPDSSSQEPV